jgi:hypothetical protein
VGSKSSTLSGTAPYHNLYVFLHSPKPPKTFAPVVSSPVQQALQLKLAPFRGLVNFSWTPDQELSNSAAGEESYSATAFSIHGKPQQIDRIALSNLDQVVERIVTPSGTPTDSDSMHVYVCTHGARDCRCGETGGQVAETLREEIGRRNLSSFVKLGEASHVGGHKFALSSK